MLDASNLEGRTLDLENCLCCLLEILRCWEPLGGLDQIFWNCPPC